MEIKIDKYLIRPYRSNQCWEIFEWRDGGTIDRGKYAGQEMESKYISADVYPGTLTRAVEMVYEWMLKDDPETVDLAGAIKRIDTMHKRVLKDLDNSLLVKESA